MYWNELKTQTLEYSVGAQGWIVQVRGTQVLYKPFKRNAEANAALKRTVAITKLMAQAAHDKHDYDNLWSRVDGPETMNYIIKTGLKGASLRKWLLETPTSEEFGNTLRYG